MKPEEVAQLEQAGTYELAVEGEKVSLEIGDVEIIVERY